MGAGWDARHVEARAFAEEEQGDGSGDEGSGEQGPVAPGSFVGSVHDRVESCMLSSCASDGGSSCMGAAGGQQGGDGVHARREQQTLAVLRGEQQRPAGLVSSKAGGEEAARRAVLEELMSAQVCFGIGHMCSQACQYESTHTDISLYRAEPHPYPIDATNAMEPGSSLRLMKGSI